MIVVDDDVLLDRMMVSVVVSSDGFESGKFLC